MNLKENFSNKIMELSEKIRTPETLEELKNNIEAKLYSIVDWEAIERDGKSLEETKEIIQRIWDRYSARRLQKIDSDRRRSLGITKSYNQGVKRIPVHPDVKKYSVSQRNEDSNNYIRAPIEIVFKRISKDETDHRLDPRKRIKIAEEKILTLESSSKIFLSRVSYWNEQVSKTTSEIEKEKKKILTLREEIQKEV